MEPALELFGLSPTATLSELRAQYYDMALLCHPDRGGTAEQMRYVCTQYEAAQQLLAHHADSHARMQQFEQAACTAAAASLPTFVTDDGGVTADDGGGGVDEGGVGVTADDGAMPPILPTFLEIFEETHAEFNQRFNTSFERRDAGDEPDPYATQGYGAYVEGAGRALPDLLPSELVPFEGVREWVAPELEAAGYPLQHDASADATAEKDGGDEDGGGARARSTRIDDFTLCTPALRMYDYCHAMESAEFDAAEFDAAEFDAAGADAEDVRWLRAHMPRHLHRLVRLPHPTSTALHMRVPRPGANAASAWRCVVSAASLDEAECAAQQLPLATCGGGGDDDQSWIMCLRLRTDDTSTAPVVEMEAVGRGEEGSGDEDRDDEGSGDEGGGDEGRGDEGRDGQECHEVVRALRPRVVARWDAIVQQLPEYEWLDRLVQEVVRAFLDPRDVETSAQVGSL